MRKGRTPPWLGVRLFRDRRQMALWQTSGIDALIWTFPAYVGQLRANGPSKWAGICGRAAGRSCAHVHLSGHTKRRNKSVYTMHLRLTSRCAEPLLVYTLQKCFLCFSKDKLVDIMDSGWISWASLWVERERKREPLFERPSMYSKKHRSTAGVKKRREMTRWTERVIQKIYIYIYMYPINRSY